MKYKSAIAADELLKLQERRPAKRPRTSSTLKTFAEEDVYLSPTSPPPYEDVVDDSDDSEEQLSSEDERKDPPYQLGSPYPFEDQGRVNFSLKRELKAKDDLSLASRENVAGSFAEMGVAPPLHSALARMSIRVPTEIQAACIPPLLAGKPSIYLLS